MTQLLTSFVPFRLVAGLSLVVGLLSAAPAFAAQDGAPVNEAVGAPGTEKKPVFEREKLTDKEKLVRSADYVSQMRDAYRFTLKKLEEARADKDVVKLNCVNEKLTNIKGLLRISEQADIALQEAVAKNEEQGADHEFTKVTIAQNRVVQLRAEAEQCVGVLAFDVGNTSVVVTEPTNLPGTDPTVVAPQGPVVNRPPPASPVD